MLENPQDDDNIGCKIDKMNVIVTNLIKDFEDSHSEADKFSMISSFDSFTDCSGNYQENFSEISFDSINIPQEIFEKFQDNLTEIDRLKMKIEDIIGNCGRSDNNLFEISLTKAQIQNLHKDIEILLKEDINDALLKVGKNLFIIESISRYDKIIYYSGNIQSIHKLEDFSIKNQYEIPENARSAASVTGIDNKLNNHKQIIYNTIKSRRSESSLLKFHAELELKELNLSKREEKIRSTEEELGNKIQQLESLKTEYNEKISELNKLLILQKNLPTENINVPNKKTDFLDNIYLQSDKPQKKFSDYCIKNNCQGLYKSLFPIENIPKKNDAIPIKISNDLNQTITDLNTKFLINRKQFNENFCFFGNFTNKEVYIKNYLKEQSNYQDLILKEIYNYENYLHNT